MRDFMEESRLQRNSRRPDSTNQLPYALAVFLSLIAVTGCGRNVGGTEFVSAPVSTAAPAVSSVSLACNAVTVGPNGTTQCDATVKGADVANTAVTWSASAGAINATGVLTAPSSPGTVTVTATSMQDPTKSASANVTVQPSQATTTAITSVAVACNPSPVAPDATAQCDATVQGTGSYSSDVRWSASEGSIQANGLLTAPAAAGNVMVTATSAQDPTKSATAAVTISAQQAPSTITSVALACNPSPVAISATSQCKATVQGTGSFDSSVKWIASAGTINANGLFTAPCLRRNGGL